MYAQCAPEGNQYIMIDSIIYLRRSTTALCYADQKFVNNGRTYKIRSTSVWKLFCQWKYGQTSWKHLSDFKESHLIKTAEYAISQNLQVEPEFNWWVPHVINKRERIISVVKKRSARYLKKTHNVGYTNQDSILLYREIPSSKSQTRFLGQFPAQIFLLFSTLLILIFQVQNQHCTTKQISRITHNLNYTCNITYYLPQTISSLPLSALKKERLNQATKVVMIPNAS